MTKNSLPVYKDRKTGDLYIIVQEAEKSKLKSITYMVEYIIGPKRGKYTMKKHNELVLIKC